VDAVAGGVVDADAGLADEGAAEEVGRAGLGADPSVALAVAPMLAHASSKTLLGCHVGRAIIKRRLDQPGRVRLPR
jgi:hypothetical protein